MATYPDLPDNRLIVGGVDLSEEFRLILVDGYTLSPPTPKTYTVDVPGSDGSIDLTESLTGDVAYENRKQQFNFYLIEPKNFENTKTLVSNYLHGKSFDYRMTMDPEYTYHGRFTVDSYSHQASPYLAVIQISVDAEPYKLKETRTYKVNAAGGVKLTFSSGRKSVKPTFEVNREAIVSYNGRTTILQKGTWKVDDLWFREGTNEIYINTYLDGGNVLIETYKDDIINTHKDRLISDLMWTDVPRSSIVISEWKDSIIKYYANKTIMETMYSQDVDKPEYLVYIQYDWKDL